MVNKTKILLTGSSGQLGQTFLNLEKDYDYIFFPFSKESMDITDYDLVEKTINNLLPDIIINCAAFTDVNLSQSLFEKSNSINNLAVYNLAKICLEKSIKLIHFSTDYIFDGKNEISYSENSIPNPLNNYGKSKLLGEKSILKLNLPNSMIIRTSWLYSRFNINFVSKIIYKINSKINFKVVDNEIGSPTRALDLANAILHIIPKFNNKKTEIYNFANTGFCSRHEFALKINKFVNGKSVIGKTKNYSNVPRPIFSAMNSEKFMSKFNYPIPNWEDSLIYHINELHNER